MDRILITYQYRGSDPAAIAEVIRVEQTIEFPIDLVSQWIQDTVVGKVEEITSVSEGLHEIVISYNPDVIGGELTQLLNVVWGNTSLLPGIRIIGLELPEAITSKFKGPRFGIAGLRKYFKATTRPLLTTAIKPMGTDSKAMAEMAKTLALAGFDAIKDDHSLANQPWSKWEERVKLVSLAVQEANAQINGTCVYAPSLNLPFDQIRDAAYKAKELGAGALLMLPGITGFDSMRSLAEDDELGLPIQGHPAMLGTFVTSQTEGIAHGILFGTLMRLAGADISIFPNTGGRFSFTPAQCKEIEVASHSEMQNINPMWIAPAGGMSIERIPEMLEMYGLDTALLIGGALSRGNLDENARRMSEIVRAY